MQKNNLQQAKTVDGFIGKKDLLKRLPISDSTLSNLMREGILPFIKLRRRVIFDWPAVQTALRNREGGNP